MIATCWRCGKTVTAHMITFPEFFGDVSTLNGEQWWLCVECVDAIAREWILARNDAPPDFPS